MENQHKKITGYGDLTQVEIDLMNEIKAHGEKTRELLAKVHATLPKPEYPEGHETTEADGPMYWWRYADGSFRAACMYLTRAVARPASF
jgi:hypothetical protein